LQVLLGQSAQVQGILEGREDAPDGDIANVQPGAIGQLVGILDRMPRGIFTRHGHPEDTITTEGVDRERRHERRIDATTKSEQHAGEAVLVDVVGQSHPQGGVELLVVV